MVKFTGLSELLKSYRTKNNLTQIDLATVLEVDARSVIRWEKGLTLINRDKEEEFLEKLSIPFQVIHNLNSDPPIAIFYDFERRHYAHSAFDAIVNNASFFSNEVTSEEDVVSSIKTRQAIDYALDFVHLKEKVDQQKLVDVLQKSADILPEINLIAVDQSLHFSGQVSIIPMTLIESEAIINSAKALVDFNPSLPKDVNEPVCFYVLSIHADSMHTAYYLRTRFFEFFKNCRYKNYTVIAKPESEHLTHWKQTGLRPIESKDELPLHLSGDFNAFLSETKNWKRPTE